MYEKYFRRNMTWKEASRYCQQHGAHLPLWKTSQHMLNATMQIAVSRLYEDYFDELNVVYIGLNVKVRCILLAFTIFLNQLFQDLIKLFCLSKCIGICNLKVHKNFLIS